MLTESRWVSTLFFPFRGLDNGVNLIVLSQYLSTNKEIRHGKWLHG
jgi:hypothetical protein